MRNLLLVFLYTLLCTSLVNAQASIFPSNSGVVYAPVVQKNGVSIYNADLINSDHLEFSPTWYQGGIVFVTSNTTKKREDEKIKEQYFELYYADLTPSGLPMAPEFFSASLNGVLHEGPVAFSRDQESIYFTRNSYLDGEAMLANNGDIKMKIFEAQKGPQEWVGLQPLPFNNNDYNCLHPTLTKDGNRMYFASDMPGYYGGMDIFYVDKNENGWGEPVNLGSEINTNADEAFPFIHINDILFFSSDREGGEGGLDLYYINVSDNGTKKVTPLEAPFNTINDDLGIIVNDAGTKGFFSSNRAESRGKDDIFYFHAPDGLSMFKTQPIDALVRVYDSKTNELLPDAAVRVIDVTEGQAWEEDLYQVEMMNTNDDGAISLSLTLKDDAAINPTSENTNESGTLPVELKQNKKYLIVASKSDYHANQALYNTILAEDEKTINIALNPHTKSEEKPVAESTPEVVTIKKGDVFVMDKIFYDFDKSFIRQGAAKDLDALLILMQNDPYMTVDLIAHTDSRGSKQYNTKLSEQRAISAKNYLVSRGIAEDRISEYGVGERYPRNQCKDGVSCSEEEHQYNRRTEIRITNIGSPAQIKYFKNQPDKID